MTPINHLHGANKDQLDSLIQVVRIFSQDIKMPFGLEKCAVVEIGLDWNRGTTLENLWKSSESGRKSSESRQKHRY